jgi:response regulator NasT
MNEPGPPSQPPRILAAPAGDQGVPRATLDALALVGVLLQPDGPEKPDALVYRLAPGGTDDLRRLLDAHQPAAVVLLESADRALMADVIALPVSAVLVAPHSPAQAAAALEVALARHRERAVLAAENEQLQQSLASRKLVERAKGALMKRFRWTEPEAFRRLQRAAMNRRVSMAELAREILDGKDVQL